MKMAILSRPLFGYSADALAAALAHSFVDPWAAVPVVDGTDVAAVLPQLAPETGWVANAENLQSEQSALIDCSQYAELDGGAAWLAHGGGLEAMRAKAAAGMGAWCGIVAEPDLDLDLSGVRGVASRHGFTHGWDRARILALDDRLVEWAHALGVPNRPGLGAAGGLPVALAALGIEVISGLAWCVRQTRADQLVAESDVVIVVAERFDFGFHGGAVVSWALRQAGARPVLVVAPDADMSRRESRNLGVEEVWSISEATLTGVLATGAAMSQAWGRLR